MFSTIDDDVHRNELEAFYKESLNSFLNVAYSNIHNAPEAEEIMQ